MQNISRIYFAKHEIMTKKDRLEAIIEHYSDGKPTVFARFLGIAPSTISSWLTRDTFDYDLIFAKCEMISPEWLLSGKGSMLKDQSRITAYDNTVDAIPLCPECANMGKPIPLVDAFAAAGFGNNDFFIDEQDVKEYYVVPKFRYCHVDFMIEVSGLSMYPHFNSGDVIACSILRNTGFIQWNKCHVIATREQGILVKRLMPGEDKKHLRAISDNKEYPPFEIPVDEITGIAIVVGSVGLE